MPRDDLDMPIEPVTVYFNPACSKCRGARALLEERGVSATYIHYLDAPPTRDELESLMMRLGLASPKAMMRTGEPLYAELGLALADDARLLAALAEHPVLLERPIVARGERALIARPPERLLELFADDTSAAPAAPAGRAR
jgi:arsenate reductase